MARGIVIKIEGDGESARRALEMVREQLKETADEGEKSGSKLAESMEMVKRSLEYAGLYMGIREAFDAVKELVGGSLELGEALMKAHERTGLTVESLSTLHYAAAVTGSDFDGLVNGLSKMNRTIGQAADGNKEAASFLKSLGLDAHDLAGRTDGAEIAFHKFISTLAFTESAARRNELAMGLMGKAGSAQIPMLIEIAQHWQEFEDRARAAGVLLTSETAQALADTNQRLNDLKQSTIGAGLAFTEGLSPGLSQMMGIISGGKSHMDALTLFGETLSRVMALSASNVYGLAAGLRSILAMDLGGPMTKWGQENLAAAKEWAEKGKAMFDLAIHGPGSSTPLIPGGDGSLGPGFEGTGGGATKLKSTDHIAEAGARLTDEQAKAAADARKAADQVQMAELEAQHKLLIVSDQDFYQEKLRLQLDELDAEQEALEAKQRTLTSLQEKQHGDKNLKRDKDGNSAEELNTQREMLQVQEQMGQLATRRAQLTSESTATSGVANNEAALAGLRAAAQLEKERNSGIEAQIALIRREHELEAQKVLSQGGTQQAAADIRALGEIEAKKVQINQVEKEIANSIAVEHAAVEKLNDAIKKDPRTKKQNTAEINALNKAEAAQLQQLVAAYDALAKELGGDYLTKSKQLHAQIDEMNTPNKRSDAKFGEDLARGMESMSERMAEATMRGKKNFHEMAASIEQDLAELAIKLSFEKWLTPLIAGAVGGQKGINQATLALPGYASGGDPTGPSIVGEEGPELFTPKGPGTVTPNNVLTKLAENGSGARGVNITSNVINQSSQPVQAQPSQVSYDSDMRQFIIHTVLEDHATGGPIAQASRGPS